MTRCKSYRRAGRSPITQPSIYLSRFGYSHSENRVGRGGPEAPVRHLYPAPHHLHPVARLPQRGARIAQQPDAAVLEAHFGLVSARQRNEPPRAAAERGDQDDDALGLVAIQRLGGDGPLELAHLLDHAADAAGGGGRKRRGEQARLLRRRLQHEREPAGDRREPRHEDERNQRGQRDGNPISETFPAAPHAAPPGEPKLTPLALRERATISRFLTHACVGRRRQVPTYAGVKILSRSTWVLASEPD